jgi:hypothetical protein
VVDVLKTQSLTSSLQGGVYLVWNVSGNVQLRFDTDGGTKRGGHRIVFLLRARGRRTALLASLRVD